MQTQLDYQVSDQALQVSPFRMAVALAVAGPSAILVWGINFALAHWYFPVYWFSVISKYDGSKGPTVGRARLLSSTGYLV